MVLEKKMRLEELSGDVRSGKFYLDFNKIEVSQPAENGLKLSGHGNVDLEPSGALRFTFICTVQRNLSVGFFGDLYPFDFNDLNQRLELNAIDLEGNTWNAEGFSLQVYYNASRTPFKIEFLVSEIYTAAKELNTPSTQSFLWFEAAEFIDIPKNVNNTITDSIRGQSFSRNQTNIICENVQLSIIDHKTHSSVIAKGKFDVDELYEVIRFYLGYSSGSMPSAYVLIIRSVNKMNLTVSVPKPIASNLHLDSETTNDEYHFRLFSNMLYVRHNYPKAFSSVIANWGMVYQGYASHYSITALALCVSIEGLLLDLFIPKLKEMAKDISFEQKKLEIVSLLETLNLDTNHLDVLSKSVMLWGDISAKSALRKLVEVGLITSIESRTWNSLRNASAHPRASDNSIQQELKVRNRIMHCVNLYHKLNLNIFAYAGGHILYGKDETKSVIIDRVSIFDYSNKLYAED
jgi:hypothetical protein